MNIIIDYTSRTCSLRRPIILGIEGPHMSISTIPICNNKLFLENNNLKSFYCIEKLKNSLLLPNYKKKNISN